MTKNLNTLNISEVFWNTNIYIMNAIIIFSTQIQRKLKLFARKPINLTSPVKAKYWEGKMLHIIERLRVLL